MGADEYGFPVPLHHECEAIHDSREGREARCRKMPIRMGMQFLPKLIGFIQGLKERDGICNMSEDGDAKFRQPFPRAAQGGDLRRQRVRLSRRAHAIRNPSRS